MQHNSESFNEEWVRTLTQDEFVEWGLKATKHNETDLRGIHNSIVPHDKIDSIIPKEAEKLNPNVNSTGNAGTSGTDAIEGD